MKRSILFLASLLLSTGIASAQCPQGVPYATGTAPAPGGSSTITTCNYAGEYNTVNSVTAGNSYTVTSSEADYLTIYDAALTVVAFGPAPLSFTAVTSGTHYTQVNTDAACGTQNSCRSIIWNNTTPPPPCPGISAPFIEDFESFTPSTTFSLENCWTATSTTGFNWNVSSAGTPSSFTGATVANSGTNFFYTEASGAGVGDEAILTSPDIDLTPVGTANVSYYYHMFGGQMGDLNVEVSDDNGATWTTIQTISGQQQASQTDPWIQSDASLAGYTGIVQIRFRAVSNGSYEGDISLDDIEVYQAPDYDLELVSIDNLPSSGCGLGTYGIGVTVNQNGAVGYAAGDTLFISYNDGTNSIMDTVVLTSTLGAGTTYNHLFSLPVDYSVPGTYNIVVDVTNSLDTIPLNNTISTNIVNSPIISSFPYMEDFASGANGWLASNSTNGASGGTWELTTPNGTIINSAYSDSNSWVTNATGNYNNNDDSWVLSPCFDMTMATGNEQVALRYWVESEFSWDGANVQYTIDNGTTWTLLGNLNDPVNWYNDGTISGNPGGSQTGWTGSSGGWQTASHTIPASLFTEPSVRFRVSFGSDGSVNGYNGFAFDNFAIAEGPVFSMPDTITVCDTILGEGVNPGIWEEYLWDSGETTQFSTQTTNGDHWVQVTGFYGTTAVDTFYVDTLYPAVPPGLEDFRLICYPDTTILDAGNDTLTTYTYLWSTGSTNQTIDVSMDGFYSVIKTDMSGICSFNDTIQVEVAQVDLGPSTVGYCTGAIPTLDAGPGGVTYLWSSGESSQTITPTSPGAYGVTVVDTNGCLLIDAIDIVESIPVVDLGPDETICINGSTTLDAQNAGATYLWSDASTNQLLVVDGATLGAGTYNYSVNITDSIGCTASDAITITVDLCAGIDELSNSEINIYPNPSNGIFNYSIPEVSGTISMNVTDVFGKVVMNANSVNTNGVIDLSNVESGIYFLNIQHNDTVTSVRLIKK